MEADPCYIFVISETKMEVRYSLKKLCKDMGIPTVTEDSLPVRDQNKKVRILKSTIQ